MSVQSAWGILRFRSAEGETHRAVACFTFAAVPPQGRERARYRVLLDDEDAGVVAHVDASAFGGRAIGGTYRYGNRLAAAMDLVGAAHVQRIVHEVADSYRERIGQQFPAAALARRFGRLR